MDRFSLALEKKCPSCKFIHTTQEEEFILCCCSVTKSYLTLQPHALQHPRLLSHSLSPGVCSHSFHWVIDAISPSHPLPPHFSSCLQSFPASGTFPMSQLFTSGSQSTRISASVLPMNIQGWFPLGLTPLIPCSKFVSRSDYTYNDNISLRNS